jgi:hypothetical protein
MRRPAFTLSILFLFASCQDFNTNSFDREKYGSLELTGGANFRASYEILQNQCINCHRHAQWSAYTDKTDWVTNENLVVPGDPNASQLIFRIINHGSASSNMPQGGSALPTAEYNKLVEWVSDIDS